MKGRKVGGEGNCGKEGQREAREEIVIDKGKKDVQVGRKEGRKEGKKEAGKEGKKEAGTEGGIDKH